MRIIFFFVRDSISARAGKKRKSHRPHLTWKYGNFLRVLCCAVLLLISLTTSRTANFPLIAAIIESNWCDLDFSECASAHKHYFFDNLCSMLLCCVANEEKAQRYLLYFGRQFVRTGGNTTKWLTNPHQKSSQFELPLHSQNKLWFVSVSAHSAHREDAGAIVNEHARTHCHAVVGACAARAHKINWVHCT